MPNLMLAGTLVVFAVGCSEIYPYATEDAPRSADLRRTDGPVRIDAGLDLDLAGPDQRGDLPVDQQHDDLAGDGPGSQITFTLTGGYQLRIVDSPAFCPPDETAIGASVDCGSDTIVESFPAEQSWNASCTGGTTPSVRVYCTDLPIISYQSTSPNDTQTLITACPSSDQRDPIGGGCRCASGALSSNTVLTSGQDWWQCRCTESGKHSAAIACIDKSLAATIGVGKYPSTVSNTTSTTSCPDEMLLLGGGCATDGGALSASRAIGVNSWECISQTTTSIQSLAICAPPLGP